jgi:hypothetical protein
MSKEDIKYPRFIGNEPIGEDLFAGKSQDRIADSIVNLLLNENDSCQMIGIDGGWGTGKSNVVKIVERKLEKEEGVNFHFFLYDAWGHQEDVQRRAILEELTENLTNEDGILDKKKWVSKLKALLANHKETQHKTKPTISLGIIFTTIAVILTPVFGSIASVICPNWLKPIVAGIPFIGLVGFFIYLFNKEPKSKEGKPISWKSRFANTCGEFFKLFKQEQVETTTYETISEDVPSVRKFRNWISEIDSDLGSTRLVLVFDNMDRLPNEKVKELWSSIHAFFADNAENNYKNIDVVVPFDRDHIRAAFTENGTTIVERDDDENVIEKVEFGDDFINKTFKVIYRVSLPILTNWKDFFRLKWKLAFGEVEKEEAFIKVQQIYDALTITITPREIIAFINEFVSLRQIHKDAIPDQYIALFILEKSQILKDPLNQVVQPNYLKGVHHLYSEDENLPKNITALVYQIPPENSMELIYTKTISDALSDRDQKTLKSISKTKEFVDILVNLFPSVRNIENAILSLDALDQSSLGNEVSVKQIWKSVYELSKHHSADNYKILDYQLVLLKNCEKKKEYLELVLADLTANHGKFQSVDYFTSINKLDAKLSELSSEIDIFEMLPEHPVKIDEFISFVRVAKDDYIKYKLICNEDELVNYLSAQDVGALEDIDFIPHIRKDFSFEAYEDHLNEMYNAHANDINVVPTIVTKLKEVIEKPMVALKDAFLHSHFVNSNNEDDFYYDLIAMRFTYGNGLQARFANQFNTVLASDDDSIASKVAESIENYMSYSDVLISLQYFNNSPLFKLIAQKLVEHQYGTSMGDSRADIKSVIKNFEMICKNGEIDAGDIITSINDWSPNDVAIDDIPDNVPLYFVEKVCGFDNRLAKHMKGLFNEYLDDVSHDEWYGSFEDSNSYIVNTALFVNYKWSQVSINAFEKVITNYAKGNLNFDKVFWTKLVTKIVQRRDVASIFKNVRDVFIRNGNMTKDSFLLFGDWLFAYGKLADSKDSLRTILNKDGIIGDSDCLDLLLNNKQVIKLITNNAATEDITFFVDSVKAIAKGNPRLEELAAYLNIDLEDESDVDESKDSNEQVIE